MDYFQIQDFKRAEKKREALYDVLRAKAAQERKKTIKKFICKGDPSIDCLRWYITTHTDGSQRIEGFSFGDNAMSMSLDCALDPNTYMPDKVRKTALEILKN